MKRASAKRLTPQEQWAARVARAVTPPARVPSVRAQLGLLALLIGLLALLIAVAVR